MNYQLSDRSPGDSILFCTRETRQHAIAMKTAESISKRAAILVSVLVNKTLENCHNNNFNVQP